MIKNIKLSIYKEILKEIKSYDYPSFIKQNGSRGRLFIPIKNDMEFLKDLNQTGLKFDLYFGSITDENGVNYRLDEYLKHNYPKLYIPYMKYKKLSKLRICITANPFDIINIARYSMTGVPDYYFFNEAKSKSVVAFLVNKNDKNLKEPLGILIYRRLYSKFNKRIWIYKKVKVSYGKLKKDDNFLKTVDHYIDRYNFMVDKKIKNDKYRNFIPVSKYQLIYPQKKTKLRKRRKLKNENFTF